MIWLKELDTIAFIAINQMNSPFLDRFFWLFTSIPIWIPLYLALGFALLKPNFKLGLVLVFSIILTFILADQISSSIFKNLFERLRPSHEPTLEGVVRIINNYRGGPFGFVSGHAANSFGFATISALIFKNKWLTTSLLIWAIVNSYSRIYLGVHYPADVICGGLLGIAIAFAVNYFQLAISYKYNLNKRWALTDSHNNIKYSQLIIFMLLTITVTLLIASSVMLKFA